MHPRGAGGGRRGRRDVPVYESEAAALESELAGAGGVTADDGVPTRRGSSSCSATRSATRSSRCSSGWGPRGGRRHRARRAVAAARGPGARPRVAAGRTANRPVLRLAAGRARRGRRPDGRSGSSSSSSARPPRMPGGAFVERARCGSPPPGTTTVRARRPGRRPSARSVPAGPRRTTWSQPVVERRPPRSTPAGRSISSRQAAPTRRPARNASRNATRSAAVVNAPPSGWPRAVDRVDVGPPGSPSVSWAEVVRSRGRASRRPGPGTRSPSSPAGSNTSSATRRRRSARSGLQRQPDDHERPVVVADLVRRARRAAAGPPNSGSRSAGGADAPGVPVRTQSTAKSSPPCSST